VGRRVDVDETLPRAGLPAAVLNDLYAHARETAPEECCGLVLGDDAERFGRVVRCRNELTRLHTEDAREYPRDGRSGFVMNPRDYTAAAEQARQMGVRVTAVYHSHVDAPEGGGVYLSELDLDYALQQGFPFPDAAHLVIAVCEHQVTGAGLFERHGAGAPFRGRLVEAVG
jgi:proteasome lid subunit RPN8/RPN11